MKLNNVSPLTVAGDNTMINDFGYQPTPTYYQPTPTYNSSLDLNEPIPIVNTGSSQILEPIIITPIANPIQTTSTTGSFITDSGEVLAPTPIKGGGAFKDQVSEIKDYRVLPTPVKTEPTIAPIKKPNYLLYGGGALLVAYIVYNLFKK
jgi:hypothetical protein